MEKLCIQPKSDLYQKKKEEKKFAQICGSSLLIGSMSCRFSSDQKTIS